MTKEELPNLDELSDEHYTLPNGQKTTPEDWGLERSFTRFQGESAFSTEVESVLDQAATDLRLYAQGHEVAAEHADLSHEELKEALREALKEHQAEGDPEPIGAQVARLVTRVRTDASSVWKEAEERHGQWRSRIAPVLPVPNADGSVASPATLSKAAGLAVALILFLLLLTTWKLALVWTWIAVATYLLAPLWRPKARTAWEEVKKHLNSTGKSPHE